MHNRHVAQIPQYTRPSSHLILILILIITLILISSHLISSLISSHLVSSGLVSSHLIYLISSYLILPLGSPQSRVSLPAGVTCAASNQSPSRRFRCHRTPVWTWKYQEIFILGKCVCNFVFSRQSEGVGSWNTSLRKAIIGLYGTVSIIVAGGLAAQGASKASEAMVLIYKDQVSPHFANETFQWIFLKELFVFCFNFPNGPIGSGGYA